MSGEGVGYLRFNRKFKGEEVCEVPTYFQILLIFSEYSE